MPRPKKKGLPRNSVNKEILKRELALGKSNGEAGIAAGYDRKYAEQSVFQYLKKHPEFKAEVESLKAAKAEKMSKKLEYSKEQWLADVIRRGKMAEKRGQFAAALKSSELIAKAFGWIDKKAAGSEDDPQHLVITVKRDNPLLNNVKR